MENGSIVNKPTINRGAIYEYTTFGQHITEVGVTHRDSAMPIIK